MSDVEKKDKTLEEKKETSSSETKHLEGATSEKKEEKSSDEKVTTKPAENISTVNQKVESITPSKPRKKNGAAKYLWGCVFIFLVLLGFMIFGGILGNRYIPKAENWLENHNFINRDKDDNNSNSNSRGSNNSGNNDNTNVKVISEENAVINAVDATKDSVVSIAVFQESVSGAGTVERTSKIGSGFIVDSNGLIVTNQHVVSDASLKYKVITSDGKEYEVKNLYKDSVNDIALVKIDAKDLKPIELGSSSNLKVGQLVIAIGTPLGEYSGSVSTGIISGLNRNVTAGGFWGQSKLYEDVIQMDAAINPGNSGGPLLNSEGKVIGVNFATISGADNISFALPIDRIKNRLNEYRKYGKFIIPYFGIEYNPISDAYAKNFKNLVAGAQVVRVVPDSPAQKGGILAGDIITEVNGTKVGSSFANVIQKFKVGDEVTAKVYRDGKTIDLKVTLAEAK